MDKMKFETPDMTAENVEKIAALFPNCVTEMKGEDGKIKRGINFEMLKQMLSPDAVDGDECYEFTWVGKKASIVEANKSIRKTLRPCLEESKDWDTTENLYIEGDNLEVLKLLQESYLGKVKMIYIDPPYNTGNDFIYADDFMRSQKEEDEQMGMYDEEENRLFKNTDTNGRFHSNWCSMMYPRLMLARNLLTDDGVIFISIDDNEQENLKKICDEVFGSVNFVGQLIHQRAKGGGQAKYIVKGHDYILVYAKVISKISLTRKKVVQQKTYEINGELYIKNDDVVRKQFGKYDKSLGDRRCFYEQLVEYKGEEKKKEIDEMIQRGELFLELNKEGMHTICRYEKLDEASSKLYSIIKVLSEEGKKDLDALGIKGFSYPKPVEIVKQLVEAGSDKNSIILDFFSGSATTAHAVMQLNAEDGGHRKFIMVQLPEPCDEQSEAYKAGYKNICEIGKERIRRAGEKIKSENSRIDIYVSAIDEIIKNKLTKISIDSYVHGVKEKWIEDENDPEVQEDVVHKNIINIINENDTLDNEISAYERGGDKLSDLVRRLALEVTGLTYSIDIGFRVLKLDGSNMKDVYYAADKYKQSDLFDMVSNIKDDRTDLDLLFGCLIDWGLPLSMPYTSEKMVGCTVHTYNNGDLIACFDENIPESVVKEIARRKPLRAVFRDSGFADSPSKINVFEIFKLYMPEDADDISKRVRVI